MRKYIIVMAGLLIIFLSTISFAEKKKCVPFCSSDAVYYYNLFVICYNDRNFCQQKKGTNCWDFCSKYIGCNGPSGKTFYYPNDPNSGKEIIGTTEKTNEQNCINDSLD